VTLTVLFTDLVGSTSMLTKYGEERFEELLADHDTLVGDAIAAHSGERVKHTGDGVMAVFPGAAYGLRAAVAVQQAIARHNRRAEVRLDVRVGLSAGDVIAQNGDYFGPAPVEASRLCDAADGGQILAADVLRVLAGSRGGFVFAPIGDLELKGLPALRVVEVDWKEAPLEAPDGVPMPARLATSETSFVGRSVERGLLDTAFKAAASSGPRLVLVVGEAGIGKTTLVTAAAREAVEAGAIVLYGHCEEGLVQPYQPIVEALDHLVEHLADAVLARYANDHGGELLRLVPRLARRVPTLAAPRATDPEAERYLLFGAVVALLGLTAASVPVVVVLDDLHWADRETLLLLRHIMRTPTPMPLLLIGTYRDDDLSTSHPLVETLSTLRREPGVERIALAGLSDVEVVALIEAASGRESNQTGVELGQALRRETDGNPFFVGELLRHLLETGAIEQGSDEGWTPTVELHAMGLPDSIREVIGHRVTRLGDQAKRVLGIAAVIGRELDLEFLARAAEVPEDDVLDLLEHATAAKVMDEVSGVPGRFRFAHALVQHTLYADLGPTRRQRTHRRVAELLESTFGVGSDDHVVELAHHWAAATRPVDVGKAAEYAQRAGDQALAALAPNEAARWYAQALEFVPQETLDDDVERCTLLIRLGEAQRQNGDPAYRQTLLDAATVADRLGQQDLLVRAALANNRGMGSAAGRVDVDRVAVIEAALRGLGSDCGEARARLLAILAAEIAPAGDYPRRRALADEALAIARELADPTTILAVLNLRFTAVLVPETLRERLRETLEAEQLAQHLSDPAARFWAAGFRATTALEDADIVEVDRCLDEMRTHADEIGQPALCWVATFMRSWRALLSGDADSSELIAAEALQLGSETGQLDAFAFYGSQLLAIRWHQGRMGELTSLVAQAVDENPGLGAAFLPVLSACHCEAGNDEKAAALLDAGLKSHFDDLSRDSAWLSSATLWAETATHLANRSASRELYQLLEPWHAQVASNGLAVQGVVAHYLGALATVLELDTAEANFAEAHAVHERLHAPFFLARTKIEWAKEILRRDAVGREGEARTLLMDARDLAKRFGCEGVEGRAAELLEAL
jgi:AAA ATPase domain/Adenylate and Guanylate cyclase catalytic domain